MRYVMENIKCAPLKDVCYFSIQRIKGKFFAKHMDSYGEIITSRISKGLFSELKKSGLKCLREVAK
jgi:hypothetical protein